MIKLSVLLVSLAASLTIALASSNVLASDTSPGQKTRAEVIEELKMAIKSGDLIEPWTQKKFKELHPNKYPMSDSDAEKMAKDMMRDVPMMNK